MKHIVKRKGHTEPYDERKVYASVYASCQSVREPAGSAEIIAEKVVEDLKSWIDKKHEVTSNDIRHQVAQHLHVYNPDAAFIYKHHRILS